MSLTIGTNIFLFYLTPKQIEGYQQVNLKQVGKKQTFQKNTEILRLTSLM